MKIAVITTKPLIPNTDGYTLRLFNILKLLKANGINITLLTLCSDEEYNKIVRSELDIISDEFHRIPFDRKKAYKSCIKAIFTGKPFKLEYYNSQNTKKHIKQIINEKDYDYILGYHYLTSQFLDMFDSDKCWIDLCDAISMLHEKNYNNSKNIFKKIFLYTEKRRVLKVEKHCIKKYNKITLISDIDKSYLSKYTDVEKIQICKNGVNIPSNVSNDYNNFELSFLGDMAYVQNHIAAKFFIEEIMPKLNNNFKCKIIGKNPKKELLQIAEGNSNVIITGFVKDVEKELLTSDCMVCPIKISAGLQNKVLEAMALGIPVITTKQVGDAITQQEGIIITAETAEEFVANINMLADNPEIRKQYSEKVRKFIIDNYSWEKISNDLLCILK